MPKLKDDQKLKDIQTAAIKLVNKIGFIGLKMAEVATEAKLATGTVYIYYKSKEALINDVYHTTKSEMIHVFLDPKHASGNFYSTFKRMWYSYFNFCLSNTEKMLFVDQFIYSGFISENILSETEASMKPFNQFIEYGQDHRLLKKIDIIIIKSHVEGTIHEIIRTIIKQDKTITQREIDQCFSLTWDGIKY
jgi:AcrR family transcriptional regulator